MNDFDHDKYADGLKLLVEHAYKEYRLISMDVPRHQAVYIRTYLWIASLLAAFELSAFAALYKDGYGISFLQCRPTMWFFLFAGLSLGASVVTFVLGTDILRGRGQSNLPFGNFTNLAQMAYEDAFGATRTMFNTVLKALNDEINHQTKESNRKGKRLRVMSWLLLFSVAFAFAAVAAIACGPPK